MNDINVPLTFTPVVDNESSQVNHELVIEVENNGLELDEITIDLPPEKPNLKSKLTDKERIK